jgi:cysteine desulfurase/selenocysteine lyase
MANNNFKKDFPIFTNHPELIFLDSGATAQKPQQVINAVTHFYTHTNANIHRGIYDLSQEATDLYESVRQQVACFLGSNNAEEIVFTGNTTEAINLVAYGWARKFLTKGDIIVFSEMEHHANIIPWIRLKDEIGVELVYLPIDKDFRLDYGSVFNCHSGERSSIESIKKKRSSQSANASFQDDKIIDPKRIKLIALTHVSNVLGTINPIADIVSFFKSKGCSAKMLIDGAQSVPHFPVNVQQLDCDFFAFSSHKMLGPSGVGVLWAKKELLEAMDPLFVGGNMIKIVTKESATWADVPTKFEAGTGKLEAVAGLGAAISYMQKVGFAAIQHHEKELTAYALQSLLVIKDFHLYGPQDAVNRLGVFSFDIANIHPHDIGDILNRKHIAVRTGHHCAQVLMKALGVSSTARASLYLYNTKEDIDMLVEGIKEVKRVFKLSS